MISFNVFLDVLRVAVLAFVILSVVLWKYLNRFHKVNHKAILNAEYKHDEMDSYTYFRHVRPDEDNGAETANRPADLVGAAPMTSLTSEIAHAPPLASSV